MVSITSMTVTREELWRTFRRTHDVRVRERYHCTLLLMEGKSCPEIAPWLSREEETLRSWVRAFNEAGLRGLARAPSPGRPT